MTTSIVFYSSSIILLIISFLKDKTKTKKALKKAYKSFMKLVPVLIPMVLFVGVLLTLVSPEFISRILGENSGVFGVVIGTILGSIAFMPGFVAFALGDNLLSNGAGYVQVAAFISTLMAVGVSSYGVEVKYFGKKMTLLRNAYALVASIIFATIVWVVM